MNETTEFSVCTSSSVKYLNKDNSYWTNPMASLGEMTPRHNLVRKRLLNALLSKMMIRTLCNCKEYDNRSGTWLQLREQLVLYSGTTKNYLLMHVRLSST